MWTSSRLRNVWRMHVCYMSLFQTPSQLFTLCISVQFSKWPGQLKRQRALEVFVFHGLFHVLASRHRVGDVLRSVGTLGSWLLHPIKNSTLSRGFTGKKIVNDCVWTCLNKFEFDYMEIFSLPLIVLSLRLSYSPTPPFTHTLSLTHSLLYTSRYFKIIITLKIFITPFWRVFFCSLSHHTFWFSLFFSFLFNPISLYSPSLMRSPFLFFWL